MIRLESFDRLEAVLGREKLGLLRLLVPEEPRDRDEQERESSGEEESDLIDVKLGRAVRKRPDEESAEDRGGTVLAVPKCHTEGLFGATVPGDYTGPKSWPESG